MDATNRPNLRRRRTALENLSEQNRQRRRLAAGDADAHDDDPRNPSDGAQRDPIVQERHDSLQHETLLANVRYLEVKAPMREAVKHHSRIVKFLEEPDPRISDKEARKEAQDKIIDDYTEDCLDFIADHYKATFGHFALPVTGRKKRQQVQQLRKTFVTCFRKEALKHLNEWRTEAQQAVTKKMRAYYNKHGNLIDMRLVERCALRNLDFNNDTHKAIFLWYYLSLIPAAAGVDVFGDKINRFDLLSEATLPNSTEAKPIFLVPPSTEAFAVVLYNNHHARVPLQEDWKNNHEGQALPSKRTLPPAVHGGPERTEHWLALYCTPGVGKQNPLGGWHHMQGKPGLRKYIALQNSCTNVRANRREQCHQWEEWARTQARLPENNNGVAVEGTSNENWQTIRNARRRGVVAAAEEEYIDWGAFREEH